MSRIAPLRTYSSGAASSVSSPATSTAYASPLGVKLSPSRQRLVPTSGTYPLGFRAAGVLVGIKPSNTTRPDLALLASDRPCAAAAVFTKNKFQAAPVTFSRDLLARRRNHGIRAVLINSGCANAVTGRAGREDAERMAAAADRVLGVGDELSGGAEGGADGGGERGGEGRDGGTLVMSTGVIGQRLPIRKIIDAVPAVHRALGSSHGHWYGCARAICTTDTFPKLLSRTFTLPSRATPYRIAGMAKGAGMIHPNLATLLGIIATDAPVSAGAAPGLLRHAVDRSFNSITIDGDTSTNDTVALLANGAAGGAPITAAGAPADYLALQDVLTEFAKELAQLVVRDGEGATKFVTIRVTDAATERAARRVASAIARSPLVKTALYGRDANWGRIVCAVGYALASDPAEEATAAAEVDPARTSVSFVPTDGSPELRLLVDGEPQPMDEERASEILALEDIEIAVRLGTGGREATYWTCDYSHEYITINGDYRT